MASIEDRIRERGEALEKIRQIMARLGWPWPESEDDLTPGYLLGVLILLYQAGESEPIFHLNVRFEKGLNLEPAGFDILQQLLKEMICWAPNLRVIILPGLNRARVTSRRDDGEAEEGDFQFDFDSVYSLGIENVRKFIRMLANSSSTAEGEGFRIIE